MQSLQIETMPLNGRSLIEASAGTGKTYTISNIILRLILMPQPNLKPEPLKIEEILVVTFTKAATQELKDRIREKINSAQRYVEGAEEKDQTLKNIVDQAVLAEDKETVYLRCREAALYLDDAPIFTIHGFCQRILKEYSFGTGQPYQQALVENNQDILQQLAQQLWREKTYSLTSQLIVYISSLWAGPESLVSDLGNLLDENLIELEPDLNFVEMSQQALEKYQSISAIWQKESVNIIAMFEGKKLGASYRSNHMPARFDALKHYLSESQWALSGWDNKADYFTQSTIDAKCKEPLQHALFEQLDELESLLNQLKLAAKSEYRQYFIKLLKEYQAEQAILFFDDLIKNLANALVDDSPDSDSNIGKKLAEQYPVALIDEFQDTDQWQYQIFREIYQSEEGQALLMIGDPKQAIYSFRGADIYTYFQARDDVPEDKQYTLDTNWRSKPELVNNVNQLFSIQADAFIQKGFPEYPSVGSPKQFADKKGLNTQAGDSTFSVLTLECTEKLNVDVVRQQAADKTAQFIAELLNNNAQLNELTVQPKDITILVRKAKQAEIMKQALSEHGVNSVYLAKDSVLNSEEAQTFLRLIKPCVNPYNSSAIHTALGDSLIAYSVTGIQHVIETPAEFQEIQQQFLLAHEVWLKKGFMPMWHQLISYFEVAERCLSTVDGERRLTNLSQIAEIYQQLDKSRLGFEQQLERFQQWVSQAAENDDHQKLRLETEANLVEIATIHSSKGLEYPLVCCPFLFDTGTFKNDTVLVYDEEKQQRVLCWQANDDIKKQKKVEEFSEDIRLLYVALTRAVYHLNCCWGKTKGVDKSAFWHLLYHQTSTVKEVDDEMLWQVFDQFDSCVINPEIVAGDIESQSESKTSGLKVLDFKRDFYRPFIARSYSALLPDHQATHTDLEGEKEKDEQESVKLIVDPPEFALSIFHFPKGADAGNFMHQVFENVDFQNHHQELSEEVVRQLKHYGYDEVWQDAITQHFSQCLQKPLEVAGCSLQELSESQQAKEMDFHLNAVACKGDALSRLLSSYRDGRAVPELNGINGLFKGFVDLIFEHDGKYFVLDYKSNFLGFYEEDYSQSAMHEAMQDHYYDLQYLVYLAALQRYLKQCLPNYDYETHIGGAYYLFLRGINSNDDSGLYFSRPNAKTIDVFEALFLSGEMFEGEVA